MRTTAYSTLPHCTIHEYEEASRKTLPTVCMHLLRAENNEYDEYLQSVTLLVNSKPFEFLRDEILVLC